ncbi:chitinase [Streptomyces sp. NBC_00237]|uniref:chitinase n=1 Tax=Streptomyces sp. NBC_00237 TaxID=2975687 RepID=UPI002B1D9E39|nr:chitinase [Streptomyces sp. NBC_00237]
MRNASRTRRFTLGTAAAVLAAGMLGACTSEGEPEDGRETAKETPAAAAKKPVPAPARTALGAPQVPEHALTGYWQNFKNGAAIEKLSDVSDAYDIIAVSFADLADEPGEVGFQLNMDAIKGYSVAQFKADIKAKQRAGKSVIISVGGEHGKVEVDDGASAKRFTDSVHKLMTEYGFDGVDIDLENGGVSAEYMTRSLKALREKVGPKLVVSMAPQTKDMQSVDSDYFKTALNIKDFLTVVNTQFYNSGSMKGCDGKVYQQGTVDFLTAQACIQLESGLHPSQVGLGLPTNKRNKDAGYVEPEVVNQALDCLTKGTSCGKFKPAKTYPGLRGAMVWSTNWDATDGHAWSKAVGAKVRALP